MSELIHEIVPVGWLQCNCSILGDRASKEGIVVDPGDEVDRILEIVRQHDLKIRAILNTHAHIDHVGGLAKMQSATGAPVLMHSADLDLYRILDKQAQMIGLPMPAMVEVDGLLREGESIAWGSFQVHVLYTPGHTRGSCCLHMPKADGEGRSVGDAHAECDRLIAGDTLFAGSIGRTDLWGGSYGDILHSIKTKLLALPDDTRVFPGHGPETTIAAERATNPFLREL